jgi:hypothetical protein
LAERRSSSLGRGRWTRTEGEALPLPVEPPPHPLGCDQDREDGGYGKIDQAFLCIVEMNQVDDSEGNPRGGHEHPKDLPATHSHPKILGRDNVHDARLAPGRSPGPTSSAARVCGLERVALHADLTMLARLSQALARARAVPLAA